MQKIIFETIGTIYTPFNTPKGTPIQPTASKGIFGSVEVFDEYFPALKDLDGFSHIILLYFFHKVKKHSLTVIPYMDTEQHGVFATRAPSRPNPIGLSIVELIKIENNILYVKNVDMLNGTPLLDIKPYVPEFDKRVVTKIGWLDKNVKKLPTAKDDGRFS